MQVFEELAEQIERQLRVQTHPLAVRVLREGEEIPAGAERPVSDLGACHSTCQCMAMSRRQGRTIAQLKEDMWCPEPAIGFGIGEAPSLFDEGHNRYPKDVASIEAGAAWATEEFPRFEPGRYSGIVSAPMATALFEPDVLIIYCDTAQLTLLLLAAAWRDGSDVLSTISSHSSCVYSVVPVMQGVDFQVTVPCMGDRVRALAGDDEMILSVRPEAAGDLLAGLRQLEATGRQIPFARGGSAEYQLPEPYGKIAREMGMTRGDGSAIE
ncbi:DUF169 domain-containing protein [Gemmatimonadota bacterium]